MKIHIRTATGDNIELDVKPEDSIKEVKALIAAKSEKAVPTHLQRLALGSETLINNRTVANYKIEEESILRLNLVSKDQSKVKAGGFGVGNAENQFNFPYGLVLDNDQTMIIVDWGNHRIMEWKQGANKGAVLVGKDGPGKALNQLCMPSDIFIDKQTNNLIICDRGNRRVVEWPRSGNPRAAKVLLENIACWGVTMDHERNLYVSDTETHTVKRYPFPPGDHKGDVVAGDAKHGRGMQLNQLNEPTYIRVDRMKNLYVTDTWNHRIMKWTFDGKFLVAARGFTRGLFVDDHETVYVADYGRHKIFRWPRGKTAGEVLNVRHMEVDEENELFAPWTVCPDGQNNIYVADHTNQRVQCFPLN